MFTQIIVRPCSLFYPYEGYRSVTPLDAARVNRTVFHNHSVHWYHITLIRVGIILSTILLKSIVFMFTDGVKFNTSVVFLKIKVVVACVIFIPGSSPCGGYWVWVFCLHHVSYLRLGDELGVCLSYYCLSGTCVLVVVQYTAVYLVQRVYLSYSKISLYYCYCCVLGILYHTGSCVCRGSVIIELVSRMYSQRGCWVCWKSKKTYFYEILTPRYHICLMRVFILLLLSIRYNVCVCHNPVYHYITATVTAVYLPTCILVIAQNITTLLLLLCTWYTVS